RPSRNRQHKFPSPLNGIEDKFKMADPKTVITLICERAVNVDPLMDSNGQLKDAPDVHVIKFPCSGMIQPLMIEAALKSGAAGVIVCGCQLGDCYFREGNRMIRGRLLG